MPGERQILLCQLTSSPFQLGLPSHEPRNKLDYHGYDAPAEHVWPSIPTFLFVTEMLFGSLFTLECLAAWHILAPGIHASFVLLICQFVNLESGLAVIGWVLAVKYGVQCCFQFKYAEHVLNPHLSFLLGIFSCR